MCRLQRWRETQRQREAAQRAQQAAATQSRPQAEEEAQELLQQAAAAQATMKPQQLPAQQQSAGLESTTHATQPVGSRKRHREVIAFPPQACQGALAVQDTKHLFGKCQSHSQSPMTQTLMTTVRLFLRCKESSEA